MITRNGEMQAEQRENMRGGKGAVVWAVGMSGSSRGAGACRGVEAGADPASASVRARRILCK